VQEARGRAGLRLARAALGAWGRLVRQAAVRRMAAAEALARAHARAVLLSWRRGAVLSRQAPLAPPCPLCLAGSGQ
jgi:hypothetical protein